MATTGQVKVNWYGDKVLERLESAEQRSLQAAADDAAAHARASHPGWHRRSGTAESSLHAEPVRRTGSGWLARFGFHIPYGRKLAARDNALGEARDRAARALPARMADELESMRG